MMNSSQKNWLLLVLIFLFSLFIIYGTTIPFKFTGVNSAAAKYSTISWHPFKGSNGGWTSRFDLIQNIILFFPAGVAWGVLFSRLNRLVEGILVSCFYGVMFSCCVEALQLFTSDRVVSCTDVICNGAGSVLGYITASIIWIKIKNGDTLFKKWRGAIRTMVVPVIGVVFITAEFLRPFDFTLDTSMVLEKMRLILANLFKWIPAIRNEPTIVLLYMFLTYTLMRNGAGAIQWKRRTFLVVFLLFTSVFVFTGLQLVVISRLPAGLDIVAGMVGIVLGIIFCKLNQPILVITYQMLLFCSMLSMYLLPFTVASEYQKGNWSPELLKCSSTMMWFVGHLIEMAVLFTFIGISTLYLVKNADLRRVLVAFDIGFILTFEAFQLREGGYAASIGDLCIVLGILSAGMFILKSVRGNRRIKMED